MTRKELAQRIAKSRAVAVLRMPSSRKVVRVADAIVRGGVTTLEVTLTTPGALQAITQLANRHASNALIGVGSVLTAHDVAQAADSGARFIVSPVSTPQIIESAHQHGLAVMPGAFTPTEIQQAHAWGADFVKVFPAEFFGPKYIRALLKPLPHLKLCPTGGVTPENAGEWIRAGASVVGIGSALVDRNAVEAEDYEALTKRARILTASVQSID